MEYVQYNEIPRFITNCLNSLNETGLLILKVSVGQSIEEEYLGHAIVRNEEAYMTLFKEAGISHLCRFKLQISDEGVLPEVIYIFNKHQKKAK